MIAEDIASTSKINSFHFSKSRAHVMLHSGQVERTLMEGTAAITKDILALERAALDRWGNGDPGGYLEINSPDVSYFDPFLEHRLDGLGALTSLYESIRGKVKIDQDEIINPRVQLVGGAAILTFEYASHGSEGLCSGTARRSMSALVVTGRLSIRTGHLLSRGCRNKRDEPKFGS